jgi:DMSO/TMAO reductase YedYZ molybdopterin-dependent catalytic subunit
LNEQPLKPSKRTGFLAGALGGLLMTLVLLALRFTVDVQILTEVMADWLTGLLPATVFEWFIQALQFNAKRLLFVGIFLGQIGVGGLLGVAYVRKWPNAGSDKGSILRALVIAACIWFLLAAVVTPLMGAGPFGTELPGGALVYSGVLAFAVAVFAFTLTQFTVLARTNQAQDSSRRAFMRKVAIFGGMAIVGGFAVQTILSNLGRLAPAVSGRRSRGVLSNEVTSNEDFYVVAKSSITPNIVAEDWKLTISGEGVGSPQTITYDQLVAMPSFEEYVTLTCISNMIGGDLISNALWKGVRLSYILDLCEMDPTVERLSFWAADGYYDSFPIDVARRDEVMVAYEMNGVPLPKEHGYPARIIVPGLYGMENVKWLTEIEPKPADFRGFWQKRGWADTAVIKTMSRIDMPASRDNVPVDEVEVAGVAFAGKRGISKVEVSLDDGRTWREAGFEPALSDYSWVIWRLPWNDAMPGEPALKVRATDGDGALQTAERTGNVPSGATGYHRVQVFLTEPEATT